MQKKHRIRSIIIYIILLVIFINIHAVKAEEEKDDPAFKLPEETITGKEKDENEADGKQGIQVDEKYEVESLSAEKLIPDLLLKEREQNKIQIQNKRNTQNDLDISAGNYYSFNFNFKHKQNHKKISYSLEIDKEYGNRTRPDSIYDHYTFASQLFSDKIDFAAKINSNRFDLPGMIKNRISDLSRKSVNYEFSLGLKAIENLFFIINLENTSIKESSGWRNQSFDLKILYDFNKNKSPYLAAGEIEQNKLSGQYDYVFYSMEIENQAIPLKENSQARIGAGISREGAEKVYLNPKLIILYKYDQKTDLEAGFKRQNIKTDFYYLYGKNNFAQMNLLPLKRVNYWQMYSKIFKRLKNDNSFELKIFHDWTGNFVVFDEDENNADGFWMPINLGSVQSNGIRLSYRQKFLQRVSGQIEYNYLDAWNENNRQTVPYKPDSIKTLIKYDDPLYQLSIDGKYTVEGYYDKDSNEKLGGYFLFGCLAEKIISEKLTVYAKADNIFDKRYEITKNYPGERAKFLLGCKYVF